jgi:hypothetical protein
MILKTLQKIPLAPNIGCMLQINIHHPPQIFLLKIQIQKIQKINNLFTNTFNPIIYTFNLTLKIFINNMLKIHFKTLFLNINKITNYLPIEINLFKILIQVK